MTTPESIALSLALDALCARSGVLPDDASEVAGRAVRARIASEVDARFDSWPCQVQAYLREITGYGDHLHLTSHKVVVVRGWADGVRQERVVVDLPAAIVAAVRNFDQMKGAA